MQIVIDIPEEAKKAFDNADKDDIYGCFYDYNSVIGKAIKNSKPYEERKTGKWIADGCVDVCSECGARRGNQLWDEYCGRCGAKMEGDDE